MLSTVPWCINFSQTKTFSQQKPLSMTLWQSRLILCPVRYLGLQSLHNNRSRERKEGMQIKVASSSSSSFRMPQLSLPPSASVAASVEAGPQEGSSPFYHHRLRRRRSEAKSVPECHLRKVSLPRRIRSLPRSPLAEEINSPLLKDKKQNLNRLTRLALPMR